MRRLGCWLLGTLGLASAAWAQPVQGDGLSLPQLQGRVRLGMSATAAPLAPADGASRISGASLLGDYYFGRTELRDGDVAGFRATSGVFLGSRLGMWGGTGAQGLSSAAFSVETQTFGLASAAVGSSYDADGGAVPYFGLGYSGSSAKGGWGFSADLGLLALNPASAVRFGRSLGSGQSLEDTLREMRLSPVLQLGASYSF
ncbi:MAG: hypothetical protein M9915_17085 [Rhizobacter sp.]|jgi:hypothetical protein|nr:hypothetical protein [Burkholderiaceae bacterium]MCO5125439.1 hypothetical protein [Rhizobacter sp.]